MTRFDSTSWSLVLGAAASEPDARERFCRRYEPVIRSYLAARWRLDPGHERISDVSQEVFLRLFGANPALKRVDPVRPSGFRAFLRGMVNNVASEMERSAKRQPTRSEPGGGLPNLPDTAESVGTAFDKAWAEMVIDETWVLLAKRLPERRSGALALAALQLRFLEGLKPSQLAARLGLTDLVKVYRLLDLGRYQFRVALQRVMAEYHPDLSSDDLDAKCRELLELL